MKDKKKKVKNKKKFKLFKIKNPKKAGIMSFIIMLVISALLVGSIITLVLFSYIYSPNLQTGEQTVEDDGTEVVVTEDESAVIDVV
jgi:hypothetical protein